MNWIIGALFAIAFGAIGLNAYILIRFYGALAMKELTPETVRYLVNAVRLFEELEARMDAVEQRSDLAIRTARDVNNHMQIIADKMNEVLVALMKVQRKLGIPATPVTEKPA